MGISFPAGSGLVAFAAATGVMPLDMPESVLVKFTGEKLQPGVTLRDLVNAIPYKAIQEGDLTVAKAGKKNIFSGRILELDMGPLEETMKVEQAFELSDASAERSAAGCAIKLGVEPLTEYLESNIVMLKWMVAEGYGDPRTLSRRANKMRERIDNPQLLTADPEEICDYAAVYDIPLESITEPILCAPNDPDDARLLSECCDGWEAAHLDGVQSAKVDEVFIGSCMTNIGHFRAAGKLLKNYGKQLSTKLWVSAPTKMDEAKLIEEGYFAIYGSAGARTEMPGCSLCMGNQARVNDKATVVSTSTRNFPNRLGNGANVFLSSAEVAAVAAILGRLPTPAEYREFADGLNDPAVYADTYRYLNFHEIDSYVKSAEEVDTVAQAAA